MIEEEDPKRPSRERENLVGERTRTINRMKSALVRLGIRGFKPQRYKGKVERRVRDRGGPPSLPRLYRNFG